MVSPFSNYFDSNVAYLKFGGAWLPLNKNYSKRDIVQIIYNVVISVFLFVFYFPSEFLPLWQYLDDKNMFVRVLRDLGNHASLYVKAFCWYSRRKEILELMDLLTNYDVSYEKNVQPEPGDNFEPHEIVKKYKKMAQFASNLFLRVMYTVVIFMSLSVYYVFFFQSDSQYKPDENGHYVYAQPLVINVVSPFGSGTRLRFFVTFAYVALGCVYNGIMIGALDSLFITIISCISGHFRIVEGALKTIRARCILRLREERSGFSELDSDIQMEKELKRCLIHEKMLRSSMTRLQEFYSTQITYQLVTSLLEICFCLYILSLTIDSTIATEISYIATTSLQLLIYCWFGQKLADASHSVGNGLYSSEWYFANKTFRINTIFAMERLKHPSYIFLAKIVPLSLGSFITIARGSYSVFTVLRQRNQ